MEIHSKKDYNNLIDMITRGNLDEIVFFCENTYIYDYSNILLMATENRNLNIVTYICETYHSYYTSTSMETAIIRGYHEIFKYIYGKFHKYYHKDLHILDFALKNNHLDIAMYLLENGDHKNNYKNILPIICEYGNIELVNYIFEHGTNIDIGIEKALFISIVHNKYDIVKYICEHINKINDNDIIIIAIRCERLDIVKLLLQCDNNINISISDAVLASLSIEMQTEIYNYKNKIIRVKRSCKR